MSKRAVLVPIGIVSVALILLFTIHGCWTSWEGNNIAQRTDDAYVRADMTPMSTRVSGTVKKMDVGDFESVKPGQTLVELEDADYRAALAEAESALAGAQAQFEDNQAAKRIQDVKIENAESVIAQSKAAVTGAKASVAAVRPDVIRTALELKRQEGLLAPKAAPIPQLGQAEAAGS